VIETNRKQLVVIGLGNPGKKYETTRHNVGFMVLQAFARLMGWSFKEEKRFEAQVTKGQIGNVIVHLILPMTYMNESGRAVRRYLDFYRLDADVAFAISDDVDQPLGSMRFRPEGSAGGHNGLKSLEKYMGTKNYARLRIGIGAKLPMQDLADHVLSHFTGQEVDELGSVIDQGVKIILRMAQEESVASIMNGVNKKVKTNKPGLPKQEGQENQDE